MIRTTRSPRRSASSGRSMGWIRIAMAVGLALFAFLSFLGKREVNPITGERQYISLTPEQEVALGQQSAPQLIQEFGGLTRNSEWGAYVDEVGRVLVRNSVAADTPYVWDFHLLDDSNTVNAFALPGGQIFITEALFTRFDTEDQLAGVLGHEIGHVLARHGSQRIAQQELQNGLLSAVLVAGGQGGAQTAAIVGQFIQMSYGREDELESDFLGVCLMIDSGYDPNELKEVMRILAEASGGSRQPEFASTHPAPENRIQRIEEAIDEAAAACPNEIRRAS